MWVLWWKRYSRPFYLVNHDSCADQVCMNCRNPDSMFFFKCHGIVWPWKKYFYLIIYLCSTYYVSVYQFKMDFSPFDMYYQIWHHLWSFAFQMWFILESLETERKQLKRSERHSNKCVNKSPTSSQGKLWRRVTPGNTTFLSLASPDMENKPKCFACSLTLSAGWASPEALTPLSLRPPLRYRV